MSKVETIAKQYGEMIRKQKLSADRVAKKFQISEKDARKILTLTRVRKNGDFSKKKATPTTESTPVTGDDKYDPKDLLLEHNYVYNKEEDTYVTFLPGVPKPLVLPGTTHRDIIKAYSNYAGDPASINQIARDVKLPRNWIVKYLRIHGVTHDSEPFSTEEIESKTDDVLVEDALQLRRAGIYRKIEKAKWQEEKNDAMKWRSVHEHIIRVFEGMSREAPPPAPPLKISAASKPYAAIIGLTDYHWGKYSDPGQNFEEYSRTTAKQRLFSASEDALSNLVRFGRPEKIYIPIGSDFLHIDTEKGSTSEGTPQDMDGTPQEILESACHLLEDWIQSIRSVAPVELVLMSGNHDRLTGFAMLLYLSALYKKTSDVTVRMDRTPRVYCQYGKNLIGFVHGDGVFKTPSLAGLMAQEAPNMWGLCPHRTVYTGHLHYEKTETDTSYGVVRRQMPSLSGTDRWHSLHGYVGSPKNLPIYVHDKDSGLSAIVYGSPSPTGKK